jgi:hypothetical protein
VTGYQTLLLTMASTIALAAIYLLTRPEQRQAARQRTRTAVTSISSASQRTHTTPALLSNGHPAGPQHSAGVPSETAPGM